MANPFAQIKSIFKGHFGRVCALTWSANGRYLVSASLDRSVCIWDVTAGTRHAAFSGVAVNHPNLLTCSPDGQKVAVSSDLSDHVLVYETSLGGFQGVELAVSVGRVTGVAWSPRGETLAVICDDGTCVLYSVRDWSWVAHQGRGKALALAFNSSGKRLAILHEAHQVEIFTVEGLELRNPKTIRMRHNQSLFSGSAQMSFFADPSAPRFHPRALADLGSIAWGANDKSLIFTVAGGPIVVWDLFSSRPRLVLEGYSAPTLSVSVSHDRHWIAGATGDGRIRVWRASDGEPWGTWGVHPQSLRYRPVFSPTDLVLAGATAKDHQVTLWSVLPEKKQIPHGAPAIRYVTAKVVLLGESGVGKTGLGWRLAHGHFKDHPSTHGQQFWVLDQLRHRRGFVEREGILWDLAGQPDYRLIHTLFLDDADVALILFDPSNRQDPLRGVEYWLRALGPSRMSGPKVILVGARSDRGDPSLTDENIRAFCRDRGITGGYIRTSAVTGEGLDDLIARVRSEIPWERMTATITTREFKAIKDCVLELREAFSQGGSPIEGDHIGVVLSVPELRMRARRSGQLSERVIDDHYVAAAKHLEHHGFVKVLRGSDGDYSILLAPDLLNNLAASFVLEARRNPMGLGALEETRVRRGEYNFPELVGLSKREKEILLDAAAVLFLRHNVCFRETLGANTFLIFPALINQKRPMSEETDTLDDMFYTVAGAVENVYAALVVLLGYTNTFTRTDQWQHQAQYEFESGEVCGFRLVAEREGEIDMVLYYGKNTTEPTKALFQGLFERFLSMREVMVTRYPPLTCSQCGYLQGRDVVVRRVQDKKPFLCCVECGHRIELIQPSTVSSVRNAGLQVEHDRRAATQRTAFEAVVTQLKGYLRTARTPACFVSYAWGDSDVERWVEKRLATDLANSGIKVILDRWDNAKIGSDIARFISQISQVDFVIVVGTPLYRLKFENELSTSGSIVAAEVDLIHQRLTGTEQDKLTVLPVLLRGERSGSFPPLIKGRVCADFRDDVDYFASMFDLILTVYDVPFNDPAVLDHRDALAPVRVTRGGGARRPVSPT